ncbi:MAG: MATE family efflux transporter [Trueperaceae bacterium]
MSSDEPPTQSRARRLLPVLGEVWTMSVPIIFTNLLQTLVNVADVLLVGRLGPIEVAAVGMSQVLRMLMLVGLMSITTGSMVLVAQARGARDPERVSRVVRQSLLFALMFGVALAVIGWWISRPLLVFLNSGEGGHVIDLSVGYLRILFIGATFLAVNFVVNKVMQGAGDVITPLYLTAGVNVLNVLLAILLIFGFGPIPSLGVAGAALSTILSRLAASVVGVWLLYSGRNVIKLRAGSYRPDWRLMRQILAIGVPSGAQGVARNLTQLFVLRILTSTSAGALGAAALAIGTQVTRLIQTPGLAIGLASTAMVGSSLGAWQTKDARLRGNVAMGFGVVLLTLLAVPVIWFAPALVRFFEPTAEGVVMSAGVAYLRIVGLSQPLLAIAMVANGALRGAGDTLPGLYATLIGRWLVSVPLAYLLALRLGMGPAGVWWALAAGTALQAGITFWRWSGRGWLRVAIRQTTLWREHLRDQPLEVRRRYLEEVRTPLMAIDGVIEEVDEVGVHYETTGLDVRVRFGPNGFEVARHET